MDYYSEDCFEVARIPGLLARSRDGGAVGTADPSNSRDDVKRPRSHALRKRPTDNRWTATIRPLEANERGA
jgi:hypothetical protein